MMPLSKSEIPYSQLIGVDCLEISCSRTPYKSIIKNKKVMGLVLLSVHFGLLKHPQL
jgi:hypothetical protein